MRDSWSANSADLTTHFLRWHFDPTMLDSHVSLYGAGVLPVSILTCCHRYWTFTACIVLLFSASNKLLEGQFDGVEQDLAYGKGCLDMLEACRSFEPVAARYLDTLWPLYETLRDIHRRMVGRAKTSISSLLQSDPGLLSPPLPVSKTEMTPISEKLSELLTDPFGRKQDVLGDKSMRRVLNNDGSCLVFWWK
jgi:hypothetical protein